MIFRAESEARAAHERLRQDSENYETQRSDHEKRVDRDIVSRWRTAKRELDQTIQERGTRYIGCTFNNYECKNPLQEQAVEALKRYVENADDNLANGKNVLLFGPKGSGKDHLLIALAKSVFEQTGESLYWENGVEWFEHLRKSAMGQSGRPCRVSKYWETRMYHPALERLDSCAESECPIFCLSDPLPPSGPLSEFQQTQLFRVIDRRYSNLRPTWISLNVSDGNEAEQRLGAQAVDRLRDGALAIHCNWESFRKVSQ